MHGGKHAGVYSPVQSPLLYAAGRAALHLEGGGPTEVALTRQATGPLHRPVTSSGRQGRRTVSRLLGTVSGTVSGHGRPRRTDRSVPVQGLRLPLRRRGGRFLSPS